MQWAIGVDGGGTHTRAVLVDREGAVRDMRTGGCGNYQRIGAAGLRALLDDLLPPLLAGVAADGAALCLALAGAGRPREQQQIARLLKERRWSGVVRVESDARAALMGAHAGAAGLIAIAGTGSIVLGQNQDGQLMRAGGWGPLLGDEGGGYYLGLRALRAVARQLDGAGPDTALVEALAEALDMADWSGLIPAVYGGSIDHERIAALGPLVTAAAERGDVVALDILERAGGALGDQVVAVARRLGLLPAASLCCMGGVLGRGGLLVAALERAAAAHIDQLQLRPPQLPAALGAVMLAWGEAGEVAGADRLACLRATRPPGL